ncbi:MAG: hypothetical protein RMK57_13265 [Bryobacterales bacterium]|nr:hypothetical protein [Bryobacteraceae bacterium]MDW8355487.1 hypothetical protein [Bryobacterales bacterium]
MAVPPLLEPLSRRPFSFYPPILNIDHNEWLLRRETWSEILVVNSKTGQEVWVPRRYLGEISSVDEPVMIVGLTKELEYKAGSVWPHERRVIEMPRAVQESRRAAPEAAPVVGMRREEGPERRVSRLIGGVLLLVLVCCVLLVVATRRPVSYRTIEQFTLGLTSQDDYYSIVRKLGPPAEDRWREGTGELQYRLLYYPRQAVFLILMGTDRDNAHYIGAMDRNWRVVHAVELPNGANSRAVLRSLRRF